MFGIGPLELIIVLVIVLVLFGAKRLPAVGRDLGAGMRGFKDELVHPADDEQPNAIAVPTASERDTASAPTAQTARDS
jgi:sec-independent protein translocase protein TatA